MKKLKSKLSTSLITVIVITSWDEGFAGKGQTLIVNNLSVVCMGDWAGQFVGDAWNLNHRFYNYA